MKAVRLCKSLVFPSLKSSKINLLETTLTYGSNMDKFIYRNNSIVKQIPKIHENALVKVSVNDFKRFCTSQDLSTKKCLPCNNKEMRPMTEEAANELLVQVAGWNLVKENGILKLSRTWKVKSFMKGLQFINLVGDVAEQEGHHPDLHLFEWNKVKIEMWTHSVGGLTENDFVLASKITAIKF